MDRYGPLVADRARQAFEPLHVPATDAVVELDLKRAMLPAQAHVVTAAVKTLRRQKAVFLCCECGTGKTQMGACAVHAHAAGKPYRAIVMCPPHLVETWRAELRAVFPDGTVEIRVLEKWNELLPWPREKPARADLAHHGRDTRPRTAPTGGPPPSRTAAACCVAPTAERSCGARPAAKATTSREGPGAVPEALYGRSAHPSLNGDGEPVLRPCGAALWQYTASTPSWAPAEYIHKHMRGVFDYLFATRSTRRNRTRRPVRTPWVPWWRRAARSSP